MATVDKWVGNLVKYAGDYWVTLSNMTDSRDPRGYSNLASVKSAIRTFIVRTDPSKYVAFRGELQLKNIVKENRNNPLFNEEEFKGHTRTALIHWSLIDDIDDKFPVSTTNHTNTKYSEFKNKVLKALQSQELNQDLYSGVNENQGRAAMIRQLRGELNQIDGDIKILQDNKEKLLQALNAIESLDITSY